MCKADNLTIMCRLSRNSGASNLREPQGPLRPVAGKLYLYLTASEGGCPQEEKEEKKEENEGDKEEEEEYECSVMNP